MTLRGLLSGLTVWKGASADSFVQYSHQEHMTAFEIRLHFGDGFDPKTITLPSKTTQR